MAFFYITPIIVFVLPTIMTEIVIALFLKNNKFDTTTDIRHFSCTNIIFADCMYSLEPFYEKSDYVSRFIHCKKHVSFKKKI